MIEWGFGSRRSVPSSSDTASSVVERVYPRFVPVNFPEFSWFQDFNTTIRNMPPLAFGIHNEQYDCDMIII